MRNEEKDRAIVNEYFTNGFNKELAYQMYNPDSKAQSFKLAAARYFSRKEIKSLVDEEAKKNAELVNIDKMVIINGLQNHIDLFDAMIALSLKDTLTDVEEAKFKRIKSIIKGADIMKSKDMLCKITGAYAPEKIEVTDVVYKIDFGK